MVELSYLDFDVLVERGDHGYRARVVTAPSGTTSPIDFTVPFSDLELENFLLKIGHPRSQQVRGFGATWDETIRRFGGTLFDAVFRDDVRVTYATSLEEAERQGVGLRVRLRLADVPELSDLPWEFLYDRGNRRFPALSQWTPLVRYLDLPGRIRPLPVTPPLNVLVVVAGPTDFPALDVESEWQKLQDALQDLQRVGRVQLDKAEAGTLSALQRQLRRGQYHVLHFIGHGGYDTKANDGVLAFEGPQARSQLVSGHDLGGRLHDHRTLRLVVLNACEGARGGRTDPYSGTAQSLVRQGVPAVVAMQFEISDNAAITFSNALYEAVADGYPLDAAMAEGRKAIHDQSNPIEWATPVLYLRAPDGRIFDLTTPPSAAIKVPAQKTQDDTTDRRTDTTSTEPKEDPEFSGALAAVAAHRWDEAAELLTRVRTRYPTDPRVQEKLDEARKQQQQLRRWDQEARDAAGRGDWVTAVAALEHVVAEQPDNTEALNRLEQARTTERIAGLQAELRRLHAARDWAAVLTVAEKLIALEPTAADPDGLATDAKARLARGGRRAKRLVIITSALVLIGVSALIFRNVVSDPSADPKRTQGPNITSPATPALPLPGTYTESRRFLTEVPDPADLELDGEALLVSFGTGVLQRIDPRSGQVMQSVDFGYEGGNDLLVGSGELAMTLVSGARIGFVDSALAQMQTIRVAGGQPSNGTISADGFWFTCHADGNGFLLHVAGRKEVRRIPLAHTPYGLFADGGFIYTTFYDDNLIGKVDVASGSVQTAEVSGGPVDVALINGRLWVTLSDTDQVAVLDPNTLEEKGRYAVGDEPWKVAHGFDSVWVTNRGTTNNPGTVSRLDPETGERLQPDIQVGFKPDELAVGAQELYVGNRGDNSVSVLAST
jgi:streptogramin lyase